LLTGADAPALERLLVAHRDSSMFLRSNLQRAGLTYAGGVFEAHYAGSFVGEELVGVAAHCWNGMLLLQAPTDAGDLARACVGWTGRPVTGLSGPLDQVERARAVLRLDASRVALDGAERLYALKLSRLVVPEALREGRVVCRPPLPEEREVLRAWRIAYDVETLGAVDTPEQRRRSAEFLDAQIADGHAWVATAGGVPVSLAAFNAALPDIVQLGGIYTPPEFRGRGFARCAVAASLLAARAQGVARAVLFTANPSAARSYEAVGFTRAGDYSLLLLR
jgi:GNAT superfamily N-acetyltransferase